MATGLRVISLPLQTIAGLEVNKKIELDYRYVATMTSTQAQPLWPEQPTISATATYTFPAGTVIDNVFVYVETAFAGCTSLIMDLGDGDDPDRYIDSTDTVNLFATGWKTREEGVDHHQYTAADSLDVVLTGGAALSGATAGKVHIFFRERNMAPLLQVTQP